jgi:hypothetical protein
MQRFSHVRGSSDGISVYLKFFFVHVKISLRPNIYIHLLERILASAVAGTCRVLQFEQLFYYFTYLL